MASRSVHFTEEMAGFAAMGAPDYAAGYHNGRAAGARLGFHLTIGTRDLDSFLDDPQHQCHAIGFVTAPLFGGEHLPVVRGRFNLFAPGESTGRTVMRYRLWFLSVRWAVGQRTDSPLLVAGGTHYSGQPSGRSCSPSTCWPTTTP